MTIELVADGTRNMMKGALSTPAREARVASTSYFKICFLRQEVVAPLGLQ